jgi:hypothetical protein
MSEGRKLSYIIWRIVNARDDIFHAWSEGHFEDAEDCIGSFVDDSSEAYDAWIANEREQTDERAFNSFLKHWEITDDATRN